MTKIAAVSDLHGFLPEIPDGVDVVVIAGDIVSATGTGSEMRQWRSFGYWLASLVERNIVPIGVAGNHDFLLERNEKFARSLPWIYLADESAEYQGIKYFGSPWQNWFGGWAFNAPEVDPGEEFLREKFSMIPDDTDVLITHAPPVGFFDRVGRSNVGSVALNRRVQEICPALHVFGHIHRPGVEQIEGVTLCNASVTLVRNNDYTPTKKPVPVFEISGPMATRPSSIPDPLGMA